ncbi:MAG: hypothetical protein JSS10_01065 [Verrucomicrobia bacterium]|nr:hypothetical protein [Verrucomicrobiota bacterium]
MAIQNLFNKIPGEILHVPLLPVAFLGAYSGAYLGWKLGDQLEATLSSSQARSGEPAGSKTKSCFVAKISSFILALTGVNGTGYWTLKAISPLLSSKQTIDIKDSFYITANVALLLVTAALLLNEKSEHEQKNSGEAGSRRPKPEGKIDHSQYLLRNRSSS